MTRSTCLILVTGALLSPWSTTDLLAGSVTATLGTRIDGAGCVTFKEDNALRTLKKGDYFKLIVVNLCDKPWKIRIDRTPNKDFSKRCSGGGSVNPFEFESDDNVLAPKEERHVSCQVAEKDEKRPDPKTGKPAYRFSVTESSAAGMKADDAPSGFQGDGKQDETKDQKVKSHSLEVEVDP